MTIYRNAWMLTAERMAHLNACAASAMPLSTAARELNVHPETIKNAAFREGKDVWLLEKFPSRQGQGATVSRDDRPSRVDGNIRRLKADEIAAPIEVPGGVQVKWLTRRWAA